MIIVQRLTGQQFAINPDLIERIESTPDTIVVLLDGTRYLVAGTLEEIVELVTEYRAAIVARSLRTAESTVPDATAETRSDTVIPLPIRSMGD